MLYTAFLVLTIAAAFANTAPVPVRPMPVPAKLPRFAEPLARRGAPTAPMKAVRPLPAIPAPHEPKPFLRLEPNRRGGELKPEILQPTSHLLTPPAQDPAATRFASNGNRDPLSRVSRVGKPVASSSKQTMEHTPPSAKPSGLRRLPQIPGQLDKQKVPPKAAPASPEVPPPVPPKDPKFAPPNLPKPAQPAPKGKKDPGFAARLRAKFSRAKAAPAGAPKPAPEPSHLQIPAEQNAQPAPKGKKDPGFAARLRAKFSRAKAAPAGPPLQTIPAAGRPVS